MLATAADAKHSNWHTCVNAACSSGRARCHAGAGCSAIKHKSLTDRNAATSSSCGFVKSVIEVFRSWVSGGGYWNILNRERGEPPLRVIDVRVSFVLRPWSEREQSIDSRCPSCSGTDASSVCSTHRGTECGTSTRSPRPQPLGSPTTTTRMYTPFRRPDVRTSKPRIRFPFQPQSIHTFSAPPRLCNP